VHFVARSDIPLNHEPMGNVASVLERQALDPNALLRAKRVLEIIPISRTAWYDGVREGRFPPGLKLAANTTVWRYRDLLALIDKLSVQPKAQPATRSRKLKTVLSRSSTVSKTTVNNK
jgi:predicted DNA-binding transcriptional regulator AlpA